MGSYVKRFWQADGRGMNKAERMGGGLPPLRPRPDRRLPGHARAVVRGGWLARTGFRRGSTGRQLIDILPGTLAISVKTAQALTGKSYPAAREAVNALVGAGVLRQSSKNRKSGIYVADEVADAFNAYERALATAVGDTSSEKPRRPVPQRR